MATASVASALSSWRLEAWAYSASETRSLPASGTKVASTRASATRSASLKQVAAFHCATAAMRSSLSCAFRRLDVCNAVRYSLPVATFPRQKNIEATFRLGFRRLPPWTS
jgi:hypothetical protein